MGQAGDDCVEPVRNRKARQAPCLELQPEHEVVNQELRSPLEMIHQTTQIEIGVEAIRLVDAHPRQRMSPSRRRVPLARMRVLNLEQLEPRNKPFFASADRVWSWRMCSSRTECSICTFRPKRESQAWRDSAAAVAKISALITLPEDDVCDQTPRGIISTPPPNPG